MRIGKYIIKKCVKIALPPPEKLYQTSSGTYEDTKEKVRSFYILDLVLGKLKVSRMLKKIREPRQVQCYEIYKNGEDSIIQYIYLFPDGSLKQRAFNRDPVKEDFSNLEKWEEVQIRLDLTDRPEYKTPKNEVMLRNISELIGKKLEKIIPDVDFGTKNNCILEGNNLEVMNDYWKIKKLS